MPKKFQVTFDAADPGALAEFWAVALDYAVQPPPDGFDSWEDFAVKVGIPREKWNDVSAVIDPAGEGPRMLFLRVPEGKTAKNRLHLDVSVGGEYDDGRWARVEEHVGVLVKAGATVVEPRQDETSRWMVMLDPEGNEFCVQ
ncbi:VOC family protein [Actinokineospora guangxiensis]|uniref:VOC family protein n=1 Tax=Actinokineospora guangxiensis TaxID=1490288 RepID=A0ABW0EKI1_9PSEU